MGTTHFVKIKNHFNHFWNIFAFFNTYLYIFFSYKYILTCHNINRKKLGFSLFYCLSYVLPYYIRNTMKLFLILRWFKLKYAPPTKALLWDEWKYQKHHWDEDLIIKRSSHWMQNTIKDMLIDVFFFVLWMWVLLCCLLKINWVRSCVVNVCFEKVQNGGVDGLYFDVFRIFWIWWHNRARSRTIWWGRRDAILKNETFLEAKCICCVLLLVVVLFATSGKGALESTS